MASTITSIDSSISKLAPTFQTAIKAIIESESTPLKNVQTQKDQIDVRRAVYTDVKSNLDSLQSAVQALISSQASYGLTMAARASVTPGTVGSTVLSANATSASAAVADYEFSGYTGISGIQLAKAESRASTVSSSADIALGKIGTFWLGGNGTGVATLDTFTSPSNSVTSAAIGTVADGQRELGTGNYSVQIRDSGSERQFRLVNADGSAMSILSASGSGLYTSAWQTFSDGEYDSGRGLSLTLDTSGDVGSTTLPLYTAKGVAISISESDTLRNITSAINSALQPEGRDFTASIVSNQLVLTGAQTGENHGLIYGDISNLFGFGDALQVAQNAKFKVNGIDVSRVGNTNLTDVIDGVTINLASDAAGKTARLNVSASSDNAAGLMTAFVTKFNAAFTHLSQKLASTSKVDATTGKTVYTRGVLAGETTLSSLRNDMYYRMNRNYVNDGSFKRLDEIGLSFDKDMKLVFDSTKFNNALKNHSTDLTALLDKGLGEINGVLSNYSGTSGSLSRSLTTIDEQRTSYDRRITKYNQVLTARKEVLFNQYSGYQDQLVQYNYQQQMVTAMYGSVNSSG
jgi:flagellar capping protein FliD